MADRNRRGSARPHDEDQFPVRLRMWLDENEGLVSGLVRLRELPWSEQAVEAVLAVPEVRRVRLSWELWESLVDGNGDDPDRLLYGRVPLSMLEMAQFAIWGPEAHPSGPFLSIVRD